MPSVSVVLYVFGQYRISGVAVRLARSSAEASIIFLGAWSSRPLCCSLPIAIAMNDEYECRCRHKKYVT